MAGKQFYLPVITFLYNILIAQIKLLIFVAKLIYYD